MSLTKPLSDSDILDRYKEVFQRFAKDGVIDMDKRLKYKFSYSVHRLEDVVRKMNGIVPPNRQSVYYITFFKKGTAQKNIGMFHFPIGSNTLMLIPQRVIHSTVYQSLRCSGYLINFNIDFFLNNAFPKKHVIDKKVFKSSLRPYLTVSAGQRKKLEAIFEYILRENASGHLEKNQMIALKILELLILCDRFFTDAEAIGKESIYHPTIEKFNELLDQHASKERTVRFYADALNVHPAHLNFLVKKYNGMNAKKTIDNRVFMEAQSLLATTSWSVKEIAHQLGFSDANYFSAFFQKMAGMSTTAYRAKAR
ncbi:helix-turn-helix domain-containing protein [Dinghuibacter silviterrae]|nr:helix-turn-helix domain-containing protein [Dinghuibacter silviterrae]